MDPDSPQQIPTPTLKIKTTGNARHVENQYGDPAHGHISLLADGSVAKRIKGAATEMLTMGFQPEVVLVGPDNGESVLFLVYFF
jgi:hypothetical protein